MTQDELQRIADQYIPLGYTGFRFAGPCRRCGAPCEVTIDIDPDGRYRCTGVGAVYQVGDTPAPGPDGDEAVEETGAFAMLCEDCHAADPELTGWRATEVWDRCVGYYRPVSQMNPGKQAEIGNRLRFKLPPVGNN